MTLTVVMLCGCDIHQNPMLAPAGGASGGGDVEMTSLNKQAATSPAAPAASKPSRSAGLWCAGARKETRQEEEDDEEMGLGTGEESAPLMGKEEQDEEERQDLKDFIATIKEASGE